MQTISVLTTQNVVIQYPIASVGDRILAYLLDAVIKVVYVVVVAIAFLNMGVESEWFYFLFLALPWLLYSLLFEIFMNGQTPGKRVLGIQVVKLDGTQPTVGSYVLRWLLAIVDFGIMGGAIATILVAFTEKSQRLGDMVAGTTVVKQIAQREVTANDIFIAPQVTYVPTFPQVSQLESRDIELIQRALEANRDYENVQPAVMVADKVKALLGIQTELPAVEFLYTIVKDYNHVTSR